MPFSPPDTILEVSDQYQTRLILPNPQVEITLTVFYSLTEAQKDEAQQSVTLERLTSGSMPQCYMKLKVLLELGDFPLLVSRVWVHFGRREPVSAYYEEADGMNMSR